MENYEERRRFREITDEIREDVMQALRKDDRTSFRAVTSIDRLLDCLYEKYQEVSFKLDEIEDKKK